jgi:PKD domain-containing protein/IPT/TIG domain-containing protein
MKSLKILTPALLAVALALAACTSSPSEPKQTPTTPVPPVPTTTFTVTVTANPPAISVGAAPTPSTITVTVRRSDNGEPPPDLTGVTLTTSLGEFGSPGSGTKSVNLQLVGGQATALLFPGGNAGTATVTAKVSQSTGAVNVQIGQPAAFFVGSVTPSVGDPQGGTQVTINGGGFVAPVRVTFGSAAATVRSVAPDKIVAVLPSATAAGVSVGVGQSVPVSVGVTINVNQQGSQTDTLPAGFTYALGGGIQQPEIFSVSPASGGNDGGTTVTINGTGFVAPVQVFFQGGTPPVGLEATVQSVTANRILVTSPAARGFGQGLANNVVDIRVKNVNSGFETTSAGAFRFGSKVLITSFGPGQLLFNDTSTLITIHGQGFESPVSASVANVAARVVSVTGTEVVVQSPGVRATTCADVKGPVGVVNINTGDGDSNGTFIFVVPGIVITSVSGGPSAEGGGTQITINGSGFSNNTQVLINGQVAQIVSVTPNQIVVLSPPFSGTFPTTTTSCSCVIGGQLGTGVAAGNAFVDVKVTDLQTTCNNTATKALQYVPSPANSCVNCQAPTPPPPPPVVNPPVASFTFTKNNLTVIFQDTSSNSPTSWSWNFGDATTSNQQNPVHTYAAGNTYVVTLTVSNACTTSSNCSSTTSQFVTVP